MLQKPAIDKIVALYLVLKYEHKVSDPSSAKALEEVQILFEDTNPELVGQIQDIDITERYHDEHGKFRAPSAAELEAKRLGVADYPGVKEVLEELARNNRSGCLKQSPLSFAWLVLEMPTFPHEGVDDATWKESVVKNFLPIVGRWMSFATGEEATSKKKWQEFKITFSLWPYFKGDWVFTRHPATLVGQAFRLYCAGASPAFVRNFIKAWALLFATARKLDKRRRNPLEIERDHADRGVKKHCWQIGEGKVIVLETDDARDVRVAFTQERPDAIVSRKSSGNTSILFSLWPGVRYTKTQVGKLYEALAEAEPGLWYLEERTQGPLPIVMNGGEKVKRRATERTLEEIRMLMDECLG